MFIKYQCIGAYYYLLKGFAGTRFVLSCAGIFGKSVISMGLTHYFLENLAELRNITTTECINL